MRGRLGVQIGQQTLFREESYGDNDLRLNTKAALPFDAVAQAFLGYYDTPRGIVRREVVRANLSKHLSRNIRVRRAVDIGCGAGGDSAWLALKGCDVVGVDPSSAMLSAAAEVALVHPSDVGRLQFIRADDSDLKDLFRGQEFDLVLCHGVLMYQDDDGEFLDNICRLVRPGGALSLLTKNAHALAYRSVADRNFKEAFTLLRSRESSRGRLGIEARAHSVEELSRALSAHGLVVDAWYGVRVFTDIVGENRTRRDLSQLLELETAASTVDPYRSSARLIHLIARKSTD